MYHCWVKSNHGFLLGVVSLQGDSTPTANFDVDASYPWNPRGDGLLMQSLNFPVALVTGASLEEVWRRASSNGRPGERRVMLEGA